MAFWNQSQADFSNLGMAPTPEQMSDTPEPAGFLESAGEMIQAGLVTSGTSFWMGVGGTTSVGADWVKSQVTGVDTTEQQDIFFGQVIDPAVRYLEGMNHKERTMAGGLTYGIGKVLTEFAGGGAPAMAVAEFSGRATGEVYGGKSAGDANMLALNQAAFAYAGAALPGALGGTIAMKAASGAGINVVAGVGQRATEAAILRAQGDVRAQDISVFGLQDMVIDAVLGAAFGTLEPTRGGKPMPKPDGKAVDGAMTIDRARFEDAQVAVRAPEVLNKVDRGIKEHVRALQENRAPVLEPLPDAVTMTDWLVAKPSQTTVVPELDDVAVAIAKLGGLDRVEAEAQGIDPAYFNERRGIKPVFRKEGGATFDQMAERLDELGYPVRDAQGRYDANKVLDIVDRSLRGEQVLTVQGIERAAQVEGWRQMQESNRAYAEQMRADDAFLDEIWETEGKDISGANEAEIAEMFGIKPDPEFKAFQQEIAESRAFVDLELPMIEDVDPSTVAEVRKTAQEIEATGRVVDDAEVVAADDYVSRVKSIGDIMGCMLRLGA